MKEPDRLFINTYKKRPVMVRSGNGAWLTDESGREYLDFLSGISINNIGYGNKEIEASIKNQLSDVIHPSNYYYTRPQIELADKLLKASGMDRLFFANSGAEANEAALSFLNKCISNSTEKNELIIFEGSFLGRTFGLQQLANGRPVGDIKTKLIKFNDPEAINAAFSDKTLAIHVELVLGHGGIKPLSKEVSHIISKYATEHQSFIYVDEVQTGLGRTGDLFAYKQYELSPSIVTLGKSLGGGLPLSATLVSETIADRVKPGDYGCTMGGNSLACAAGIVVMNYLSNPSNLQSIRLLTERLKDLLLKLKSKHSSITDVRGLGLMRGIEVKDKAAIVMNYCIENGLLLDIVDKNVIRLLPPFILKEKDLIFAFEVLDNSFSKAEQEI